MIKKAMARQSLAVLLFIILGACSKQAGIVSSKGAAKVDSAAVVLDVYKSPSCGCCEGWIDHIQADKFTANVYHPDDLNQVKIQHGIQPRYQSCHTAVSQHNFVFEGHVPVSSIKRFLAAPPVDSIGLAVPGMPVGSPGMEMGDRYDDYDVLLLKKDGSSEVFEHITGSP